MRYHIFFGFVCFLSVTAYAEDAQSPAWRGAEGSTFQQWDFLFAPAHTENSSVEKCLPSDRNKTPWGQRGLPDKADNPYERQSGICLEYKTPWSITNSVDWLKEYKYRGGVWRLDAHRAGFNFIDFTIPGRFLSEVKSKETQVQLTYSGFKTQPVVKILVLSPENDEQPITLTPVSEYQSKPPAGGWEQRTYVFKLNFCPSFENVQVFPAEYTEVYIDKVVIDTLCHLR